MTNRADALIHGIEQLVTLPAIYFEIKRVIESPNSTMMDIAKTISTDPALAAKLLRIVNSPIFAQSRPVETITRAVSMLGMVQIHDLALAASLSTTFSRIPVGVMDMHRFWVGSVLRATLMKSLARDAGLHDRERAFLQGLLSDVGHLVMYLRIPDACAVVLHQAKGSDEPLFQIERQNLGCDAAQVGASLLRRWGLPEGIHHVLAMQNEPEECTAYAQETALLNIATTLAWAHDYGQDGTASIRPAVWALSKLDPGCVPGILAESLEDAARMSHILNGNLAKVA
jgi:HD-like signal output (HDOD) protein